LFVEIDLNKVNEFLFVGGSITSITTSASSAARNMTTHEASCSKLVGSLSGHDTPKFLTDVTSEDATYDDLAAGIPSTNRVLNDTNNETRVRSINKILCCSLSINSTKPFLQNSGDSYGIQSSEERN